MPASRVEVAARRLRLPCLIRLATKGGWVSKNQQLKALSVKGVLEFLQESLEADKWESFSNALTTVASSLSVLSLAKIERYCEAFGVKDVELNMTKATAVVDLYLGNPDKFPDVLRLCESYRLGAREIYTVKKGFQSKVEDFDPEETALKLEQKLSQLDQPVFKGRELMVQIEKRKGYWEALVYYEQRPRQFRVFKQKRQIGSLEVRPVALLHLACAGGQRLEVKARSPSALAAALPVLSDVLTGSPTIFEPDKMVIEVAEAASKEVKLPPSPDGPARSLRMAITSLLCRGIGLPGSPTIRVSVAQPKSTGQKQKAKSPPSVEDVAATLKKWTGGKLDLLRAEIVEADCILSDADTGEVVARFKYVPNSPKRWLPVNPTHRRLVDEWLSKVRR